MVDKFIILVAIILLFIGVAFIFLSREFIRKKTSVENENTVVRNFKIVGFVVSMASLVTIYFCIK